MNYNQILDIINQNIKRNEREEITGPVLNSVLRILLDFVDEGFINIHDIVQVLADSKSINILGSINPSTNTEPLPDGVYHAQIAGKYENAGGIVVKEGYYTLLRKKDGQWKVESEVKIGASEIKAGKDEFVVGGKDGITSRKITGKDIIHNPNASTDNPFIIPTFNFILDKWTSGLRASKNPSYATIAQRLQDGRLKASKAINSDDLVPYEQMPIKRFINKDLANKYAEEFGAEGELIIVVNENRRVYQINEHKNLQVLIDKGSSNTFTSLSDTPDSYPKEDYYILRNKDGKLIFTTLLPADFKIPNKTERQVLIYESEREGFKAIPYSEDALPNTFAKRTDDGRVKVADPIDEDDAIPLSKFNRVFGEYMLRNGENLTPEDIEVLREILEVPDFDEYELPVATKETLGGVIVGENLNIDESGKMSATDTTYEKGTLEQLVEGKDSAGKLWSAKTVEEWSKDKFALKTQLPTTAQVNNWNAAYSSSHNHSNKPVLDGITQGKVNSWEAKLAGIVGSKLRYVLMNPDGSLSVEKPSKGSLKTVLGYDENNEPKTTETVKLIDIDTTVTPLTEDDLLLKTAMFVICPNISLMYLRAGAFWKKVNLIDL